jgi:hypothetical protein
LRFRLRSWPLRIALGFGLGRGRGFRRLLLRGSRRCILLRRNRDVLDAVLAHRKRCRRSIRAHSVKLHNDAHRCGAEVRLAALAAVLEHEVSAVATSDFSALIHQDHRVPDVRASLRRIRPTHVEITQYLVARTGATVSSRCKWPAASRRSAASYAPPYRLSIAFISSVLQFGENQDVRAAMKKTRLRQDSVLERPLNQHPATVLLVRSNPVQP